MVQCPRCSIQVTELHAVDGDLKIKVEASGEQLPPQICLGCVTDLRKMLATSSGGALMAQARAKDQHRINLWKSRVHLVKKARAQMSQKQMSEAAVSYEKYIKILEIVFECKNGEKLKPELFKEGGKTTELTVLVSVYWDLIRIYDAHPKYYERQIQAASQLGKFIQFTPIFSDIVRRAESFLRQAKNPSAVKMFLKTAAKERPRCFIATAAFDCPRAEEIIFLRKYRDQVLKNNYWGRKFIYYYYRCSPRVAKALDEMRLAKIIVRGILRGFVFCWKKFFHRNL